MTHLRIRKLIRRDLEFAQRLRGIAGWNQTEADWERLLAHEPDGCFVCELDGRPAGTATTTAHGDEAGWIGMVLVDPEFRRQGVATRLLNECIAYLKPMVRRIKLDATPAGMKVYAKLGFVEEWLLHRWRCESLRHIPSRIESATTHDEWPMDLDTRAFGADRSEYLQRLAADSKNSPFGDQGIGMLRPGAHSHYLGPVVADSRETGRALIDSLLPARGPVIWDIPDENRHAAELAVELGFTRERPLIRMRLGPAGSGDDPLLQWAIGGPETG